MYEYRGPADPSRLLQWEISENEVGLRMHFVTGPPIGGIHMAVTMEPYSRANLRPPVSRGDLPTVPLPVGGRTLHMFFVLHVLTLDFLGLHFESHAASFL